jgi:hypothetical protein
VFRGVFPSWDNSARRGAIGTVILNGTPENYEYWLSSAIDRTIEERPGSDDRIVFINAWNEWAEGCHLEPDRKYGHAFLEATQRSRQGTEQNDWAHVGIHHESRSNSQDPGPDHAGSDRGPDHTGSDQGPDHAGSDRSPDHTGSDRPSQKQKNIASKSFKAVRDTLNGRRFSKRDKTRR